MIHTNPSKAHGFPGDDCQSVTDTPRTCPTGSERELTECLDKFGRAIREMTKEELAQAPGKEPTTDFIQSGLHAELCRHDVEKVVQTQHQAAKAEARLDENRKWKSIAEKIVEKHGVYMAVNYLNLRLRELDRLQAALTTPVCKPNEGQV
jgi:hypothetical protein